VCFPPKEGTNFPPGVRVNRRNFPIRFTEALLPNGAQHQEESCGHPEPAHGSQAEGRRSPELTFQEQGGKSVGGSEHVEAREKLVQPPRLVFGKTGLSVCAERLCCGRRGHLQLFFTFFDFRAGEGKIELQDFLELLPPEIQHKMLTASRTSSLRRTSKTMRTAVENADSVVQAKDGIEFPGGRGLLDKLNGLDEWCRVTVLRLNRCTLGKGAGRSLERGVEAQALHLNTTVTSLDLDYNAWERAEGGRCRDTAPQQHACVARPPRQLPGRGRRADAGRGAAPQHHDYVAQSWRE